MGLARRDYNRAGTRSAAFPAAGISGPFAFTIAAMLRALAIRHFAIIESAELEFQPGFSVISGETGAGKSILIDALGLLLGDRASAGQVAAGQGQADLSAEFDLSDQPDAGAWLKDQDLHEDEGLIVRRVISAEGGSRAWINGRSATIRQLAELGEKLAEIHGQHEHQLLSRPAFQREILDRQVDEEILVEVRSTYQAWQQASAALRDFERDCGDPAQLELLGFQHRELETLALQPGEYEALEQEQERIARSDEVRDSLARARAALDDDAAPSARGLLLEALAALDRVAGLDPQLTELAKLLGEARINVDEAIRGLERAGQDEPDGAQALERVNRRLEKCLDLARKHRIRPEQLPALTAELGERLASLGHQDERREILRNDLDRAVENWRCAAAQLSQQRRKAAETLAERVAERLSKLGMSQSRLIIDVEPRSGAAPAPHGHDDIGIRFSANPGQPPQALQKVASGGELSRISLALMISARAQLHATARVFDEVDAGIGGETAHAVGQFLREAAEGGQAFCVTHLAQVAARADHHFRVEKSSAAGRTRISIKSLNEAEREQEVARMLGSRDSASSLAHARELLAAS
ncbi:MAG: DNA repair protein RecN [Wenzhouxiangella sp.]|nr:MAG: DNA repair protein RecN [Wenzhouxiangella sp.]